MDSEMSPELRISGKVLIGRKCMNDLSLGWLT